MDRAGDPPPYETDLSRLSALVRDNQGWYWAAQGEDLSRIVFHQHHATFLPCLKGVRPRHLSIDGSLLAYSQGTEVRVHSLPALRKMVTSETG